MRSGECCGRYRSVARLLRYGNETNDLCPIQARKAVFDVDLVSKFAIKRFTLGTPWLSPEQQVASRSSRWLICSIVWFTKALKSPARLASAKSFNSAGSAASPSCHLPSEGKPLLVLFISLVPLGLPPTLAGDLRDRTQADEQSDQ